jgi:hypothetical protein
MKNEKKQRLKPVYYNKNYNLQKGPPSIVLFAPGYCFLNMSFSSSSFSERSMVVTAFLGGIVSKYQVYRK